MTDFTEVVQESIDMPDFSRNPYAGKNEDGTWNEGYISISFLNNNFGSFTTSTEMKNATESEGLKLYFDWLAKQNVIPA